MILNEFSYSLFKNPDFWNKIIHNNCSLLTLHDVGQNLVDRLGKPRPEKLTLNFQALGNSIGIETWKLGRNSSKTWENAGFFKSNNLNFDKKLGNLEIPSLGNLETATILQYERISRNSTLRLDHVKSVKVAAQSTFVICGMQILCVIVTYVLPWFSNHLWVWNTMNFVISLNSGMDLTLARIHLFSFLVDSMLICRSEENW